MKAKVESSDQSTIEIRQRLLKKRKVASIVIVIYALVGMGFISYTYIHQKSESFVENLGLTSSSTVMPEIALLDSKWVMIQSRLESLESFTHLVPPPGFVLDSLTRGNQTMDSLMRVTSILITRSDTMASALNALRQAIDPSHPEEVLTIARMADRLDALSMNYEKMQSEYEEKRKAFVAGVIRELDRGRETTTLFIVVLIPLIANLVYTVWKDLKSPKPN